MSVKPKLSKTCHVRLGQVSTQFAEANDLTNNDNFWDKWNCFEVK